MRRAALYLRISADRAGLRAGVERQERECRELAYQQGWEVVGVYVDNDTSAYRSKPRKDYRRLLDDLNAGRAEAVVAHHPDRLYRRTADLEELITVAQTVKAPIATVLAGTIDLSNATGQLVAKLVADVAHYEVQHKGERHVAKDRQLAEQGRPHGGPRVYGYRYESGTLCVVDEEAEVVRELARRVLDGESVHELAREMTERGVPTARGKSTWHHMSIGRLLRSATLAGRRVRNGDDVRQGDWPAILTMEQHRALVALLTDPARRTNRTPRRYLLTGIARCGLCGAGLMARPKVDRRRNYLCRSCGQIGVLADPLEELVTETLFAVVEGPDFAAHLQATRHAGGGAEDLTSQLQELAELWAARQINKDEWLAARAPLQRQLEAQRREDAKRARAFALDDYKGDALRTAWPQLDLARRRAILVAVVEAVVVGPAVRGRNRFDDTRVSIQWRA